jgi:hypothetical protein
MILFVYLYYIMVDYCNRNESSLLDKIRHSKYNGPKRDELAT